MLRFLFLVAAVHLLQVGLLSNAPDVTVERVHVRREIVVRVTIKNNSPGEVVVPYCGDLEGERYLCNVAVRLEILVKGKWRDAEVNCDCAILGDVESDRSVRIGLGSAERFQYAFPADYFKLTRGQKTRLRVQVWSSEESMKRREPSQTLHSDSFRAP